MKRFLLFIPVLLFSICTSAQIDKVIPKRPSPPTLVNDFTNTLTQEQIAALESKLVANDNSTSNQIAIVIIPTTGDYSVDEVALEIGRNWGVGNKSKNNGIVLLVAKNDKHVSIQVAYGLEGAVPDIMAKSIIDNDLIPNFKEGNYYRGLDKATDDIIKVTAGEYKAPAGYGKRKKGIGFGTIIFLLIIIFGVLGGIGGRGGGGGFGAGWIIGSMMGGGGRGGGGWSGGGGGGFGGFGGGSFGGGGASGSW